MSNVKQKEGDPLMEKPQPVPGQEPDMLPPPYSSLLGSQSQPYIPVPSAPIQTPYPNQPPYPVDSMVYNPMGQAMPDYGKPVAQPPFNSSPYASTTYDANVGPVNLSATPNQTMIVPRQSAYAVNRARRCLYFKICFVIVTAATIVGVSIRVYRGLQHNKEVARHRLEEDARAEAERFGHKWSNNDEELEREINALIEHNNHILSQYNPGRKRRMAGQEETDHSKDYEKLLKNY